MVHFVTPKDLRSHFGEQLKCLDVKLEVDCAMLSDFQDFYRRRAALETEYADGLAKLVNNANQRHTTETTKRPHLALYTSKTILKGLIGSTLRLSQAHSTMGEVFAKQMVQRLVDMDEDAVRIHKQCRDMLSSCHERILSEVGKLQVYQREYVTKQSFSLEAERIKRRLEERMLMAAGKARVKGKDPNVSQRFLRAQKEYSAKYLAYTNANDLTSCARNDYLLHLKGVNSSIEHFVGKEAPDIVDCLTCGFHNGLARASLMHSSCEEALKDCHGSIVERLNNTIPGLDWRQDRATFLSQNKNSFACLGTFRFTAAKEDGVKDLCLDSATFEHLEKTAEEVSAEIDRLHISTEDTCQLLDDVEGKLLDLINQKDYDVSCMFLQADKTSTRLQASVDTLDHLTSSPAHRSHSMNTSFSAVGIGLSTCSNRDGDINSYLQIRSEKRDNRIETERSYFVRFCQYTAQMHLCNFLQSKLDYIRAFLNTCAQYPIPTTPPIWGSAQKSSLSVVSAPKPTQNREDLVNTPPPPPAPDLTRRSIRLSNRNLTKPTIETTTMTTAACATAIHLNQQRFPTTIPDRIKSCSKRRVLQVPNVGKPKLFGSTIDEYMKATGETIPYIITSCTQLIAQSGLQQRGIFRVSGGQIEINELKNAFEHGQDPFENLSNPRDMNAIAGLLKLYFRELGEPPFPSTMFDSLAVCIRDNRNPTIAAKNLGQVITHDLSRPVFIVMRYLFAFLNHVSEYSYTNSMDVYNLAICFGPGLLHVPVRLDQVNQQSTVIDIIKIFIQHHSIVFDPSITGPVYTKPPPVVVDSDPHQSLSDALSRALVPGMTDSTTTTTTAHETLSSSPYKRDFPDGDQSLGEASSSEDLLDDDYSESESNVSEAGCNLVVARADFVGNSARELSFEQGDELFLYVRRNEHWWEGQLVGDTTGTRGLIPHVYVMPKLKLGKFDESQLIEEEGEEEEEEEEEEEDEVGDKSQDELSEDNLDATSVLQENSVLDIREPRTPAQPTSYRRYTYRRSITVDQVADQSFPMRMKSPMIKSCSIENEQPRSPISPTPSSTDASSYNFRLSDQVLNNIPPERSNSDSGVVEKQQDLEEEDEDTQEISKTSQLPCSKHTPDLVMDLPDTSLSSASPSHTTTTTTTTNKSSADNFAADSDGTMRKRVENRPPQITTIIKLDNQTVDTTHESSSASRIIEPDSTTENPPTRSKRSVAERAALFESSISIKPPRDRPSVAPKPKNQ